ncbi:peptidase M4 [Shewanella cyperi]|uniref:Peptidase M4 n=2 Tax=Shewanella cyperi TaxID=2814292 RepID=A0A974XR55_9GAMM|nr:peptidase M4 [Shewanella cyperi]QSX42553.1 peptidase M4 [Shewanella cyperi]
MAHESEKDLSSQVLDWVAQGRVLPLDSLLQRYQGRLDGRLLDLEVEQEGDRIIYELEILRQNGQVIEIKLDAATGEWLTDEGH